jgi:hypothetical protein
MPAYYVPIGGPMPPDVKRGGGMPIEKAFAIKASSDRIFAAIERELSEARQHQEGTFEVLERDPPRLLRLRVAFGALPCHLTYRLSPRDGDTEVSATLEPFGLRYAAFQVITLGMNRHGFEVALVEGLANLKAAVEATVED